MPCESNGLADDIILHRKTHFFAAAAEAMRRILIDRARSKRAVRHGGGRARVDIQSIDLASPGTEEQLLAVNEALDKLAAQDAVEAQLVKLRYFVGLTVEEAATRLDISPRTASNYWAHAGTWLYHEIKVRGCRFQKRAVSPLRLFQPPHREGPFVLPSDL